MVEITSITLVLTLDECTAVYEALGRMTSVNYSRPPVAEAGSTVYNALTLYAEEIE